MFDVRGLIFELSQSRIYFSSPRTMRGDTLNDRDLRVAPARDTETVEDCPRGVRAIECVEMDAGNVVIQKIVTLFQGEVNADAGHPFRIFLASL